MFILHTLYNYVCMVVQLFTDNLSLLQQTSIQAVWFASTQAVPGTACGAPPVM
jgi:hypothetical protein